MKKDLQNKLNLYFLGIKSRYESNFDYFISFNINFKSGTKIINATYKNNILNYNGVTKEIADIYSFFENECSKYEFSEFIYKERGQDMIISVTPKDVVFKKTQTKQTPTQSTNPLLKDREYLVNVDDAKELLKAIGILTGDYKLRNDMIRKYNQIDKFVEIIAKDYKNETDDIVILDLACGKSYLSFVLNYYLKDVLNKKCKIIGIDYSQDVINESNRIKNELSYNNMQFIQADLNTYTPPSNVTSVISLHACDTATDLALSVGIKACAKYITCVPCCHKELLNTYEVKDFNPIFKHKILNARFNDILTDGLRALKLESFGYKVTMSEYISPIDTPKNLLIYAKKVNDFNKKATDEYNEILSMLKISPKLNNLLK